MATEPTIRTLIVDDERIARRGIRALLRDVPDVEIIGECEDGVAAVSAIRELHPDLVFLDIQMPELDGFEVLGALGTRTRMPVIIFVTAYDEYAIKAFGVHALDYLLKPVKPVLMRRALQRARAIIEYESTHEFARKLNRLLDDVATARKYVRRFPIRISGEIYFIDVKDIDWIEAYGDYVRLHTGKKKHLLRKTLTVIQEELDPSEFIRIHRSAIVHIKSISSMRALTNGDYAILLADGSLLTLSRTYRDSFFNFVKIAH